MLEVISFACVAAGFVMVAIRWNELPAQVPSHFGASGLPNRWSGKGALWVVPGASVVLYILLTVASRYQRLINVPFKIERGAPETQRLLLSMSIVVKTVMSMVFAYITWASVNTAMGRSEGLGRGFLPVVLAATSAPLVYYLVQLQRHRS